MYETNYHRPSSLADAIALFKDSDDARFLSGGQTLIPVMKQRLAAPSDVIDIAHLEELKGIEVSGDTVSIGAGCTHAEVNASDDVRAAIPALAEMAGMIGDPAVRHRGTIGGSLANNDPAADYPAALLALNATVQTDRRSIGADDFLTGLFETALEEDEAVVRVTFRRPAAASYQKFRNPASRYAMAGAFVARFGDGTVRVGVTGAGSEGAFRPADMEAALASRFEADAVADIAVDAGQMLGDIHGSAEYRAHLVNVMVRRAVTAAG